MSILIPKKLSEKGLMPQRCAYHHGLPQLDSKSFVFQVYFFKGHILAGQCIPDGKEVVDYAWLTKQEIQKQVEPHYWNAVKDMLSDF